MELVESNFPDQTPAPVRHRFWAAIKIHEKHSQSFFQRFMFVAFQTVSRDKLNRNKTKIAKHRQKVLWQQSVLRPRLMRTLLLKKMSFHLQKQQIL